MITEIQLELDSVTLNDMPQLDSNEAATSGASTLANDLSAATADAEINTDGDDAGNDTQIVDLITGEPISLSDPKEIIRQDEERKLLEEFNYPEVFKRDLIRLNATVRPQQGKSRRLPLVVLRADDAMQPSDTEQTKKGKKEEFAASRLYILFDIQAPKVKQDDPKKGADQTAELLKDTPHAEFAVWTNGTERVVYWKEQTRIKVRERIMSDIPRFGRGSEDCYAIDARALRQARGGSLRQAFQRCHNYIYANRGGSNESVFWEFLKIVFAKIQDERYLAAGAARGEVTERRFAVKSIDEHNDDAQAAQVKERIEALYSDVRQTYPELFAAQSEEIDMPANVIAYVVSQIGHYDFLGSSVDVKGEAYEAIVGKNLTGTRGEFFTPRNAVKLGIYMLDPKVGDKCIDPACGTGGFIVVILNYLVAKLRREMQTDGKNLDGADYDEFTRRLKVMSSRIFGLDINPELVKVARMNMVMNNDGQGGITALDSLKAPDDWKFAAGTHRQPELDGSFTEESVEAFFGRELQENSFDICAANPPFGAKIRIDSEKVLTQYELARRWSYDGVRETWTMGSTLQGSMAPEILFIERCVRLLKPGTGRACIVVPDGILGNPDDEYIRFWLMQQCEILALVDMPVELFLPKVGIQTHLVFLRRKSADELNEQELGGGGNNTTFMSIAHKVGKDRRDNPTFKRDREGRTLTNFLNHNGDNLHLAFRDSTVLDFLPEVDEYGRMRDDDLPFIAQAYRRFLQAKDEGEVNYAR